MPGLKGMAKSTAPVKAEETQPGPPPEPQDTVFSFNPQDPRVMNSSTIVVPGVVRNARPETAKVRSNDTLEPVNGKYVYPNGDSRQAKAQAFAAVNRTVNAFMAIYGDFPWQFGDSQLGVNGDAGKFLNAFYKRENKAVTFYHFNDQVHGSVVFSAMSSDIAAHETAHAILDGIRPQYYQSPNPEPRAFHEAFGDIMAIHMALMDDRVLNRVVIQTGGDLSKPNVAALIAEEMGEAVNNSEGKDVTGGDYLRSANNNFEYTDISKLPEKGTPTTLGWDRHSLGRLWTGAHFDFLKAVVNEKMAAGMAAKEAIKTANVEVFARLAYMMKEAPQGDFTFPEMAATLLRAEEKHGKGQYTHLIHKAFSGRKMLPENLDDLPARRGASAVLSATSGNSIFQSADIPDEVTLKLDDSFGMFAGALVEVPYDPNGQDDPDTVAARTRTSMRRLIDSNRVRYNDPNYQMKFPQDYLNPKGDPYVAAVYWEEGQMVIRPLAMAICD